MNMADQRFLNAYILGGVMKLFQDYDEDGERVKVTCAEAVEALQHTQSAIYSRLPMDFTERLLPRVYQGEFQVFTQKDFLSAKPYEYLFEMKNDPLQHEQAFEAVQKNAHAVGIKNFSRLYEEYLVSRQV